jgi:hypothetical protein
VALVLARGPDNFRFGNDASACAAVTAPEPWRRSRNSTSRRALVRVLDVLAQALRIGPSLWLDVAIAVDVRGKDVDDEQERVDVAVADGRAAVDGVVENALDQGPVLAAAIGDHDRGLDLVEPAVAPGPHDREVVAPVDVEALGLDRRVGPCRASD